MAVTKTDNPVVQPLPNNDPRFPLATWSGFVDSTGDATGGLHQLNLKWSRAAPEQLVSVEDIRVRISAAGASRTALLQITPGELTNQGATIFWAQHVVITLPNVGTDAGCEASYLVLPRMIWNPKDAQFSIAFNTLNVNLENPLLACWGYIWDIQSLKYPPGPIRPNNFVGLIR